MKNKILEFLLFIVAISTFYRRVNTEEYVVQTKTGVGPGSGTDACFNITLISPYNDNVTLLLDGKGDALEAYNRDEFKYSAQLVYPIDRMILQRVDKRGWSPDWFIHWITVEVKDTLYVFRIGRWINSDQPWYLFGTLGSCKENYQRIQQCVPESTNKAE